MEKCPVCGKGDVGTYDVCPYCNWISDQYCDDNPEEWTMICSLNFAKKLYDKYGDKWTGFVVEETKALRK